MDYDTHTKVLYWSHELLNVWMIIGGIIIYTWYPYQITNDTWWSTQCPVTAYTEKTTGASGTIERLVNGWTKDLCLDAAPIKQFTNLSYWMITFYSISFFNFAINAIWFNDGGVMHEMWWRWSQLSIWGPIVNLCLLFVAQNSYGMKQ